MRDWRSSSEFSLLFKLAFLPSPSHSKCSPSANSVSICCVPAHDCWGWGDSLRPGQAKAFIPDNMRHLQVPPPQAREGSEQFRPQMHWSWSPGSCKAIQSCPREQEESWERATMGRAREDQDWLLLTRKEGENEGLTPRFRQKEIIWDIDLNHFLKN